MEGTVEYLAPECLQPNREERPSASKEVLGAIGDEDTLAQFRFVSAYRVDVCCCCCCGGGGAQGFVCALGVYMYLA